MGVIRSPVRLALLLVLRAFRQLDDSDDETTIIYTSESSETPQMDNCG